jgi:uncharacterized protein (DUF362 family)
MSKDRKAPGKKGTGVRVQLDEGEPRAFSRREMISRVLTTSGAAVTTVGLGVWLTGRRPAEAEELESIRDHRVTRAAGAVEMAIARGGDAATNTRKALAALGGIEQFVQKGERVVIKPNVGWNRKAEQAANTNPEVVAEVVRQVKAAGAAAVWVTDVTVNHAERCFARSGIRAAAEEAGAKVILPNDGRFRTVAVGGETLRVADVLWPFIDADKVINLPIVKQHGLARATMSMKNWYGVLGGHRVRLHQDIDRSIFELTAMMKPTLTVLDATRVLMANGPSGGSLDDVKRFDTVAAGVDEVALDAFGASFLGVDASSLGYLALAEKAGLGRRNFQSLELVEVPG